MKRRAAFWSVVILCGCCVLAWNVQRFVGAKAVYRSSSHLDFVPSPAMARAMSLGHRNTFAKLRWIQSFSYAQHQFEARDDTIAGSDRRGGFVRLYETLLHLDPYFEPYYTHGTLMTSGIVGDHQSALYFLWSGIHILPHNFSIWNNAAAHIVSFFDYENRHPHLMQALLEEWVACMEYPEQTSLPLHWISGLGTRKSSVELQQARYWVQKAHETSRNHWQYSFIRSRALIALSKLGIHYLTPLLVEAPLVHTAPVDFQKLGLNRALQLSDIQLTNKKTIGQLLQYGILSHDPAIGYQLNPDPFGFPWLLSSEGIISTGLERAYFDDRLASYSRQLRGAIELKHKRPQNQAELEEWGIVLPEPPVGCTISIDDNHFRAVYDRSASFESFLPEAQ